MVSFPAVTLSNHLPRRKDVRLPNGKKQIKNNLCGKKPLKKVTEAHFQKVLKRQKSANSTKKCSNDNLKSAQTTISIKTLYFSRKSFCEIWGAEWHLLLLGETKVINSSLYEQKNHFSYPVSVADDGNFSCHCEAESRDDLHFPVRATGRHALRALERQ